ncbi:MAG: hypothetical protein GY928_09700 [Colwellia sp.]|nr:hypothetical protein [Colwellia sp.]
MKNDTDKYIQKTIIKSLERLKEHDKAGYYQINLELIHQYSAQEDILKNLQKHYFSLNDHKCLIVVLSHLKKLQPKSQSILVSLIVHSVLSEQSLSISQELDSLEDVTIIREQEKFFSIAKIAQKNAKFEAAEGLFKLLILKSNIEEEVKFALAALYIEMKSPNKAICLYKELLTNNKQDVALLYNLATLEEEIGNKVRAIALYRNILCIQPSFVEAQSRYLYLNDDVTENDQIFQFAQKQVRKKNTLSEADAQLCFALGKVFDSQQNYQKASHLYTKANSALNYKFDQDEWVANIVKIKNDYQSRRKQVPGNAAIERPIFISGLFRSGSTLVEQIVSSHSKISCLGEVDYFQQSLGLKGITKGSLETAFNAFDITKTRERYISKLKNNFGGIDHLTNKNMECWLLLGKIIQVFPHAKIIYTSRGLFDNALAIYFQHLSRNQEYSADMEDIIFYVKQHQALMDFWKEQFPQNIYEVQYENVINNTKKEIKGLLNFLDLSMEDSCLEFYKNKSQINTASIWQVRRPLYKSSVGRWKNYQRYLPFP